MPQPAGSYDRDHILREIHLAAVRANHPDTDRAMASVLYAVTLAIDIDVEPAELTPTCRILLQAHDTARLLTERADTFTRWAAEVGGALYRWHVTGLGEVDTADMIAHAAERGIVSRFAERADG